MLNNGIYLHLVKIWIFFKKIPNFLGSVLNGAQVRVQIELFSPFQHLRSITPTDQQ